MNSRGKDGSTLRDNLLVVQKTTGVTPPELLNEPELDSLFYEIWSWFLKLHNRRPSNGFGISSIPYSEIKAFFELIGYTPQTWEIDILEIIDDAAIDEIHKQQSKETKANKPKSNK